MYEIPNIKLVKGNLEGTIFLPVWKTFQSRQGVYGSVDTRERSNGLFRIEIGGDMDVTNPSITLEHLNAYNYLTFHSEEICSSILTKLLSEYKNLQEDYSCIYDDVAETMPNVDDVDQFKNLIGLSQIHLMNISKDEFAYVGYEFGCTWDDGHGLGFMTHKDKIVDFGGADMSFMTWVAKKDLNNI